MQDPTAPYNLAELLKARARLPRRGLLCHVCGLRVPQFAALDRRDRRRIIRLISERRPNMAVAELRNATSCPDHWAWLWVLHNGRPGAVRPGPQCRRCRMSLKSTRALRCVICGTDNSSESSLDPESYAIPIDRQAKCYPP